MAPLNATILVWLFSVTEFDGKGVSLFPYHYRHCTYRCPAFLEFSGADIKYFSMYLFQPVAKINTFLFRSNFPMRAGNGCERSTLFQKLIHNPHMLNILIA